MGRKKLPKSERKHQIWLQVKNKYLKEAKEKAREIEQHFQRKDHERISSTKKN
jgi:hypothetical protein